MAEKFEDGNAAVAVILVNWNSYSFTHDCLLSLRQVSYPSFTVIVVDNGSEDGSGEQLQNDHPEAVVLFAGKNLGFTGGNNLGLKYSLTQGFEYSMLLNNDTFVEPDFLSNLVAYLKDHPETGAVQPRIYFNHDRSLIWNGGSYYNDWTGFSYTRGEGRKANAEHLRLKEVDWITGCAFLTRNAVLSQTSLLADNMFIYSEDVDLSFRIKKLGFHLVYVPASVIYHIAGSSNKDKTKGKEGYVKPIVHYLNQRNRIWLLKKYTKWYQAPTVVLANLFYILLVICYFAARCRFGKIKAVIKAVKDGLSGSIQYN